MAPRELSHLIPWADWWGWRGSWSSLPLAVGQEAGGAAVHELGAGRGGTPRVHFRALTQAVACGEISAGQGWPHPRPCQQPPAQWAMLPARWPAGGAQLRTLLRAVLCALISQVWGWTGPWLAQPAVPCDSCCPVCWLPRSLSSINEACGSAAAEPSGQQTALLHALLASLAAQDLDRRQDQVRGRLTATGPPPLSTAPPAGLAGDLQHRRLGPAAAAAAAASRGSFFLCIYFFEGLA